ncbi:MAG: hypothetical protein CL844_01785 [Crocinitomicaceae bacterium]|nr:hypothetical protein [Crocinitomicaceae bacterium]|tara:strand:+ start:34880 stop:35197 length:318 start_codon:yes stop_codon:yes gene_type:complete
MKYKFLNNRIKNKRFHYSPLFYDKRKENLEIKKLYYTKVKNNNINKENPFLRDAIKRNWNNKQTRKKSNTNYNIRILSLIIILLFLGYFMFNGLGNINSIINKIW